MGDVSSPCASLPTWWAQGPGSAGARDQARVVDEGPRHPVAAGAVPVARGPAGPALRFYLGTHQVCWLGRTDVPLFVSHRRLALLGKLPKAAGRWALDSGGFSELSLYGRWETTPTQYATAIGRYHDQIRGLDWAAPQDWMCEPFMLAKTGRSIDWHQQATIDSYQWLNATVYGVDIIPVLQGWHLDDYLSHVDQYAAAGVDLTKARTVGLGSVCRRQATGEIAHIVRELAALGLRLHGFGVKTSGLSLYGRQPRLVLQRPPPPGPTWLSAQELRQLPDLGVALA